MTCHSVEADLERMTSLHYVTFRNAHLLPSQLLGQVLGGALFMGAVAEDVMVTDCRKEYYQDCNHYRVGTRPGPGWRS